VSGLCRGGPNTRVKFLGHQLVSSYINCERIHMWE